MNDYQAEVKQTIELLFQAANRANGRVLDAGAVRRVCSYIQNLVRIIEQHETALIGADNMLAAYIEEYGEDLMNTLLEQAEEVVEGEIVDEETSETGLGDEVDGVDSPLEGEESGSVSETGDEDISQ